ncbi:hypothetical protein COBT_001511 [Conglomerata obtusa]
MILFYINTILPISVIFNHHYYYEDIQRCSKPSGVYIMRLRISFEQNALVALQDYLSNNMTTQLDYQAAAQAYIAPIIADINVELMPFGIHIRADYGQLIMENFPFKWDKANCQSDVTVLKRVEVARSYFERTAVHGVGNRLLVMHCPVQFSAEQIWAHTAAVKQCGNVLGVMYHNPDMMRHLIKREVIKLFTGVRNSSDDIKFNEFNNSLCKYVHGCVSAIGNVIGEYVNNLRNAKDVNGSNFYLPLDSRTKMHSSFDDFALRGSYYGFTRLYPLENYYNENNGFLALCPN